MLYSYKHVLCSIPINLGCVRKFPIFLVVNFFLTRWNVFRDIFELLSLKIGQLESVLPVLTRDIIIPATDQPLLDGRGGTATFQPEGRKISIL